MSADSRTDSRGDSRATRGAAARFDSLSFATAAPIALVALKCFVGATVLAFGFTHVSDDDYARVTIAQRFVAAPHLDPSGTSWLPLPFWLTGGAMFATGRSLASARVVAIALGALSPLPAYAVLRRVGVARLVAFCTIAIAMASPWSAWSGAATVPDGWTGALIAAAAFSLMDARLVAWGALLAGAAALCRYEAWPVCAVVAARAAFGEMDIVADRRARLVRRACLVVAAAGAPIAWLLWNRHAHGDALHFVARVAKFRERFAAASAGASTFDKLLEYPRALAADAPETLFFSTLALAAVVLSLRGRRSVTSSTAGSPSPSRWTWPLAVVAASLAFLVYGDLRDGAPTHHPARALIGVSWILTAWGMDHLSIFPLRFLRLRAATVAALLSVTVAALALFALRYREPPGTGDADRSVPIARGLGLRGAAALVVTPCAYEHFALLAAFERPDLATIEAPVPLSTHPRELCPQVTAR